MRKAISSFFFLRVSFKLFISYTKVSSISCPSLLTLATRSSVSLMSCDLASRASSSFLRWVFPSSSLRLVMSSLSLDISEFFYLLMCYSLALSEASMVYLKLMVALSSLSSLLSLSCCSRCSFLVVSSSLWKDSLRASLSSCPWLVVLVLSSYFLFLSS